ncbi:MAG: ABC transporter permease [Alphaproteobacteria bacterium]|nr:ABC transporter permease [Alphaproteobacteria bacterium]
MSTGPLVKTKPAEKADEFAPQEGLFSERNLRRASPYLFTLFLFVVWELGCLAFDVAEYVLPRPTQFFEILLTRAPDLWGHSVQTLYTTVLGFALGVVTGVIIGIAVGSSKLVYAAAYPLLVGFNSIPKVAIVPILVIWFGIGTVPAVITSLVISLFPVVANVATGLATTQAELEDILRALGASKWDTLVHVGLPSSLPYFFASLKISISLAFVGTVVSETIAANTGIGSMMIVASSNFDVPLVFAGLVILAVMGVALYAVFAVLEQRMTFWAQTRPDEMG